MAGPTVIWVTVSSTSRAFAVPSDRPWPRARNGKPRSRANTVTPNWLVKGVHRPSRVPGVPHVARRLSASAPSRIHSWSVRAYPHGPPTAYGDGMVVVELAFTDRSDTAARLPLRPRHREILTALYARGEVALAGPFDDGSGSMIVFTTTRSRVDEVLASDPYYAAEGVTVVSIRELTALVPADPPSSHD